LPRSHRSRELAHIRRESTCLQKRIEAVRDSVADSIVRLFGEQRPAFTGLDEEALIEGLLEELLPDSALRRSLRHMPIQT
jgi:hypothetical protein